MRARPLVCAAVAFSVGIVAAACARPAAVPLGIALLFASGLVALSRHPLRRLLPLCAAFAALGFARYEVGLLLSPTDISLAAPAYLTVTGTIASEVESGGESPGRAEPGFITFVLAPRQAQRLSDASAAPVSGKLLVRVLILPRFQNTDVARSAPDSLPSYGDRVVVTGRLSVPVGARNPGGFDLRAYLARRGIYAELVGRGSESCLRIAGSEPGANPLMRLALEGRSALLARASAGLSPSRAALLNAILLGDRTALSAELRQAFDRTGTVHILATAGLHVGICVWMLLALFRRCGASGRFSHLATIGAVCLYAIMAGGRPAVVRAAVVATVYLLAVPLEREPDLFTALAVAALFLLAQNPFYAFEAGFQLTFLTVITIALLMPCVQRGLSRARRAIRGDWPGASSVRFAVQGGACCLALAFAAQAGSAPLVACYFNDFSPVSLLANLLIVPPLGLTLAMGFLAACVSSVAPPLAAPLYGALGALLDWIAAAVRWCAHLPLATLSVPSPPVFLIVLYYAGLWSLAWRLRRRDSAADGESLSWVEAAEREIEHV